ncbi:MAG: oligosaccharide repeat unit polymerase [Flavobacteriaceae bacterium]|nr:oligosaccharide repeat unit polymerase [Flavobacteriaceae bacterium]
MAYIIYTTVCLLSMAYILNSFLKKKVGLIDYFLFWYAFIYSVVPMFIKYSPDIYMLDVYKRLVNNYDFFIESSIILLVFIFILMGNGTYTGKGYLIKIPNYSHKKVYNFSFILFFVAIFAFIIFVSRYGGLEYVLSHISSIRSGTDEHKDYLGATIRLFVKFLTFAFIIQLFLHYKGFFKKKKLKRFLFYLLAVITLGKVFLDGGRAGMISIFIFIILTMYYTKGRIKKMYLVGGALSGLFIIFFGKVFLFAIFNPNVNITFDEIYQRQSESGFLSLFIHEFNHQTMSLANFIQNDYDFRYMKDFFIWILKPVRFFTKDTFYDSVTYYNTYLIEDYWNSDIPPGFVAMGYMNGGLIGLFIFAFLIGRLIKIVDVSFVNSGFRNNGYLLFIYLFLFQYTWFAMQNGDIAIIIQSGLPFLSLMLCLFAFKRLRIFRIKKQIIRD